LKNGQGGNTQRRETVERDGDGWRQNVAESWRESRFTIDHQVARFQELVNFHNVEHPDGAVVVKTKTMLFGRDETREVNFQRTSHTA
jgi:hypothetical protein